MEGSPQQRNVKVRKYGTIHGLDQNRRQKVFNRGLCVSAGVLDILKIELN